IPINGFNFSVIHSSSFNDHIGAARHYMQDLIDMNETGDIAALCTRVALQACERHFERLEGGEVQKKNARFNYPGKNKIFGALKRHRSEDPHCTTEKPKFIGEECVEHCKGRTL